MSGASEIFDLADEFAAAANEIGAAMYETFKAEGEAFADDWRSNATQTAGKHGKHYPSAITSETKLSLDAVVEIGPESARRQGGMGPGFELGSQNQPPHLDALRAAPTAEARIEKAADATIGFLVP